MAGEPVLSRATIAFETTQGDGKSADTEVSVFLYDKPRSSAPRRSRRRSPSTAAPPPPEKRLFAKKERFGRGTAFAVPSSNEYELDLQGVLARSEMGPVSISIGTRGIAREVWAFDYRVQLEYSDGAVEEIPVSDVTIRARLPWGDRAEYVEAANELSGDGYRWGELPGAVALRTVSYHRRTLPDGGEALDAGCGEGQDLVFLAQQGYQVTGVDFVPAAVDKARRMLAERAVAGEVTLGDLVAISGEDDPVAGRQFDLVLAVNVVQLLGADAESFWGRLLSLVRPGGMLGVSVLGLESGTNRLNFSLGGPWRYSISHDELLTRFDGWEVKETALVRQWVRPGKPPELFVTFVGRRPD